MSCQSVSLQGTEQKNKDLLWAIYLRNDNLQSHAIHPFAICSLQVKVVKEKEVNMSSLHV